MAQHPIESDFDTIIVGAGSAGAVLAARLSENPDRRVLLLEAGPHYRTIEEFPREMRYAGVMRASAPGHPATWKFSTALAPGSGFLLPRGKLVGGGSAVNGALFTWGMREDFDLWAAVADERWGPDAIYPLYKRMERDLDFPGGHHGTDGPVPVVRAPREDWSNIAAGFVDACLADGHRFAADMNSPDSLGVGPLPVNSVHGIRQSTAITYLPPALDRRNLTIMPNTVVHEVAFEGGAARGVRAVGPGGPVTYRGHEVVLSAGAIKSAQLLMLSGIGPADELRRHGIDVVQESPGVGSGTSDHGMARLWYRSNRTTRLDPLAGPGFQVGLHYTSGFGDATNDMMLLPSTIPVNPMLLDGTSIAERARILLRSATSVPPSKIVEQVRRGWDHNINVIVMRGEHKGTIRLASADPDDSPIIEHNYLSHELDRVRLREGVRLAATLLRSSSFADAGVSAVRPLIGETASDAEIDQHVREHLSTAHHLSSSCPMGRSHTQTTVVDPECRVFGVSDLRVVDTSVMPALTRRGPNATAMAIGERVAEMMR